MLGLPLLAVQLSRSFWVERADPEMDQIPSGEMTEWFTVMAIRFLEAVTGLKVVLVSPADLDGDEDFDSEDPLRS